MAHRDDDPHTSELMAKIPDGDDSSKDYPYEFSSGAFINSSWMLHSIDEKQLYRQRNGKESNNERYVYVIKCCGASLIAKNGQLKRPKGGKSHNHENQSDTRVKLDSLCNGGDLREILDKHLNRIPEDGANSLFKRKRRTYARYRAASKVLTTVSCEVKQEDVYDDGYGVDDCRVDDPLALENIKCEDYLDDPEQDDLAGIQVKETPKTVSLAEEIAETCSEVNNTVANPPETIDFPYEFCPGSRTNNWLLHSINEKLLYRRQSASKESNQQRYVCAIKCCRASLILKNGQLKRPKGGTSHNHENQEHRILEQRFDTKVKMGILANGARHRDICNKLQKRAPEDGANSMFNRKKRTFVDDHHHVDANDGNNDEDITQVDDPLALENIKCEEYLEDTEQDDLTNGYISGIQVPERPKVIASTSATSISNGAVSSELTNSFETPPETIDFPYEFCSGTYLNSTLLHSIAEKQLYRRHSAASQSQRYICVIKGCPASLILKNGQLKRLKGGKLHNHETQEDRIMAYRFNTRVKLDILTSGDGVRAVFDKHVKCHPKEGANIIFNKKRRTYARLRAAAKLHPIALEEERDVIDGDDVEDTRIEFVPVSEFLEEAEHEELLSDGDENQLNIKETPIDIPSTTATSMDDGAVSSELSNSVETPPETIDFPFEFCTGASINSSLLHSIREKQLYKRHSAANDPYQRFVCVIECCRASLIMKNGQLKRPKGGKSHNHETQEDRIMANRFNARVKLDILTNGGEVRDVFDKHLKSHPEEGAHIMYNTKKRTYSRLRAIATVDTAKLSQLRTSQIVDSTI